jgi:phage shock protein A
MKYVLIAIGVVVLGWLAWSKLPGLRTKVGGKVDEYGGWTEEARREDPVGFLTYAEEKLARDIEAFRRSRETLAATRTNAEAEQASNEGLMAAADELAELFHAAFQTAETAASWPIEVQGASYTRAQLVDQVESILSERATYAKVVGIYGDVIVSADEQRKELRDRIQSSEATLVELRAQRELVRVDKLTAEADELLAQVDALINGNRETLVALDEPRSVEALLAASSEEPGQPTASSALEYLERE